MKIDGHTHTHFCPHGSGENVERMIERAIECKFDEYHITEHSPIPNSFAKQLKPLEALNTLSMAEEEVDTYLNEMIKIKEKYKDRIQIKIGFELDFIPTEIEWTKHFLNEYGKFCDTGIISVHYLKGKEGWHCLDYKPDDTQSGIVNYYGNTEDFQLAYYDLVKQSILVELGPYKPNRIGHMTLCNKFKDFIKSEETLKIKNKQIELLQLVKKANYELDFNTAGLFKHFCKETYPPSNLIHYGKSLKIPFVYGSDSHSVEDIGRGYEIYKYS